MYRFIQSHSTQCAVEIMCRAMGITRSAYYDYLQTNDKREAGEKKKEMEAHVVCIFSEHRRRYSVRRIVAEMRAMEIEEGEAFARYVKC